MKQLLRKLFASSAAPVSAPAPLRRRSGGVMLLEPRYMFDGAAVGQVVDQVLDASPLADAATATYAETPMFRVDVAANRDAGEVQADTHLLDAGAGVDLSGAAAAATALAQQQVRDYLSRVSAAEFNRLFLQEGQTPSQAWLQASQALREDILQGRFSVDVQFLSQATLRGAWGAFAAQGPDGHPVVYLNADWVRAGAPAEDIARVLVEELGHAIDARLNPGADAVGDEGELFSAEVFATAGVSESYRAMLRLQDDHRTITVDGQQVQVEFAALNFTNAYAIYTGAVGGNSFPADKEQNRHHFNPSLLGVASISDGTNGQSFSGNDISVDLVIGGTHHYGWISRPIKDQGVVRGFYFWKDAGFTTLAAAQTDGNQDGDGTPADNSGFILVVDQAWFNAVGFETGGVYKFVGSSSDRVDTALNSVMPANSAPTPVNDTQTIAEGATATGNVLTNDSDPNNDSLTVTQFVIGGTTYGSSALGVAQTIAGVGSFTLSANGSYTFTPSGDYNGTVPAITYTVSDGKATSSTATAVLSLTVTPVNDAPTGGNDSVTTSQNTTVILGLNDFGAFSDPDGDRLAAVQITTLESNGSLEYYNGTAWVGVTANQVVTAADIVGGKLRFVPDTNENGSPYATVGFKVSDGTAYSASAYTLTVNVTSVNTAPVANADNADLSAFAVESGDSVAGSNQTGNVLTNDSDVDGAITAGTTHKVTSAISAALTTAVSVTSGTTSTSSPATVTGLYGTLKIGANGSYIYEVNNSNAQVQALRTTSNTLTETFTYTMADSGPLTASSTLTVVIKGSNDAPVAMDDRDSVQETTGSGSPTTYGTTSGNTLTNDTDVDTGDTLTVNGSYATATGNSTGTATVTLTGSGLNSIDSNDYVFVNTSTPTLLTVGGVAVRVGTSNNGSITLSNSSALNTNDQGVVFTSGSTIGFSTSSTASGNYKTATYSSTSAASSTTIDVSSITGSISQGMTVTSGSTTRTVTGLTFDSSGNVTRITLNSAVSWSGAALTFSATAGTTLTGRYGTFTVSSAGAFEYKLTSNALNSGQSYTEKFSYRTTDTAGSTSDAIVYITVNGSTGVTMDDESASTSEDTTLTVADGDPGDLLVGDSGVTTVSTFNWGGQTANAGNAITVSGIGSLQINANGSYTFTPDSNYIGPVPVATYNATDGLATPVATGSATLTITITAANDAPTATTDAITTPEDTAILLGTSDFGVFSDAEGATLSAVRITTLETDGALQKYNGSSWVDVALNDEFTAADLAAGKLRFLPDANENASPYTTAGFKVSDGTDWSASAYTLTVNVTPVNDAPVNTVPATQTLFDYQTLTIGDLVTGAPYDLAVADVDGATDISSVTVSVGYGTLTTSNAGGGAQSGSGTGTVTLTGTTTQLNAMLAALVYAPNAGFSGSDALKIYTVDAAGASDTDFVSITVNPDNRTLAVTGSTVNEASPYVVWTVDGEKGQRVTLAAGETGSGDAHATMGVDFLPNLQYFDGTSWVDYTGGAATIPNTVAGGGDNASGLLMVRAAVLQDTRFETTTSTYETLKLTATNAAGAAASGNAQIRDDKAGSIFLATNNTATPNASTDAGYPAQLDDDRSVSVNSIGVNEGSQYAIFTVTGSVGQNVGFALSAGTALLEDGNGTVLTNGSEDAGAALEIWDGSAWQPYTANATYTLATATTYVRTAVNPDTVYEGQHTFFLGVTRKAAGDTVYGAGNIFDDGTGVKYDGSFTGGSPTTSTSSLDDDRSVSVDSPTVNEASDYVVFTVSGNSGQTASLALVNESSNGTVSGKANVATQTLKVWDGLAWVDYDANNLPTFDANGKIFVRVNITSEQEPSVPVFENAETFKLNATLTGTSTAVSGTATIMDDGTGVKYPGTFTSGSPTTSTSTLDDDRLLSVNNPTVNEGSPYVIFEVSSAVNATAALTLANASGGGTYANLGSSPALEYYGVSGWTAYNASSPPAVAAGGVLLVRVGITAEQESALDGPETFKLVATNASNQASVGGTGTIVDDGSGSYFAANNTTGTSAVPSGVTLDDDRTLSVDSMTVNEASDYVIFTVSGNSGLPVQLSLVNESSGGTVSGKANVASQTLKVWSGSAWVDYDASNLPTFNGAGKVFVRVDITSERDTPYEGAETFKLNATQANRAAAVSGTATIVDDGTGVNYTGALNGGGTAPVTNTTSLDDDRTLAVNDPTVNEGSPYAIFEVTGLVGQTAQLALANANGGNNRADLRTQGQLPTLEYYAGGQWNTYNASSPPTIPAGGKLLVRVAIDAEQESARDGPETFKLVATASNGQASTGGMATIVDDGTGSYFASNNSNGTSAVPAGVTLDDDRPRGGPPVAPPSAAPRVAPPAPATALPPPEGGRPAVPAFNSVLPPASRAPLAVEAPAPIVDSLTSTAGFRIVVNASAPAGLTVYRGITDQFVEQGAGTKVSLPYDAFIHSKDDAVIKLDAKQADNAPLPPWVRFDAASGTFEVNPPPGFKGRLDLKVTARDEDGREAVSIFRMFVGDQPAAPAGPQSRDSFSDKLKVAAKRPVTLIRISDAEPVVKPRAVPVAAPAARVG